MAQTLSHSHTVHKLSIINRTFWKKIELCKKYKTLNVLQNGNTGNTQNSSWVTHTGYVGNLDKDGSTVTSGDEDEDDW